MIRAALKRHCCPVFSNFNHHFKMTETKHKFYEIAYRAHCGTSFSPERRAKDYCADYDKDLAEMREKVSGLNGDPNDFESRYEQKWKAWMSAKAQCLSSMIAGPSNFPVRRAEKANATEHRRMNEFIEFKQNYIKRLEKRIRAEKKANTDPIQEMRSNIEKAEKLQAGMVEANKIIRKKITDAEKIDLLIVALNCKPETAAKLLRTDDWWGAGFAPYQLTNNGANIRRMKERLAELEKKAATPTAETERPDGIRVVENTEEDRLQVFFPGKPEPEMIAKLKSAAFKWSPSRGCWQRQLTPNALNALRRIL